jgi:GTP-binding protein Era
MTTQPLEASGKKTKAGFVAIIGAPNAGKSTLVNALVGEKVSIVTHKIQTTRFQVRGIAMIETPDARAQVVLVDTPGIFDPKHRLDRAMVHAAWSGVADADAIVHVVDADAFYKARMQKLARSDDNNSDTDVQASIQASGQDKKSYKDTLRVIEGLKKRGEGKAVFLALNKIDLLLREHLLLLIKELEDTGVYKDIFLLSALKGNGVDTLSQTLADHVQLGPFFYPEDQAADIPSRLLAAEITREKLFLRLHNELPYASHVETQEWKHQKNGIRIEQIIYVRRKSQKPIVLGKNGNTIKKIGQLARLEMCDAFGTKVHLFLFVKVRENWSEDRSKYFESGLKFDA